MSTVSVKVEFGGGLELLFSNQRSHKVEIPALVPPSAAESKDPKAAGRAADITYLMVWLQDNLLKERPELFIEGATVYALNHCYQKTDIEHDRTSPGVRASSCSSTTPTGS